MLQGQTAFGKLSSCGITVHNFRSRVADILAYCRKRERERERERHRERERGRGRGRGRERESSNLRAEPQRVRPPNRVSALSLILVLAGLAQPRLCRRIPFHYRNPSRAPWTSMTQEARDGFYSRLQGFFHRCVGCCLASPFGRLARFILHLGLVHIHLLISKGVRRGWGVGAPQTLNPKRP